MKKIMLIVALAGLAACQTPESRQADSQKYGQQIIDGSNVLCSDGHQIRVFVYSLGQSHSSFAAWPILNDDGTPKKCVNIK